MVCELELWSRDLSSDFALWGYLYGGVKLPKNVDPGKYSYCGFDIGFDTCIEQSLPNVNIFLFLKLI